MKNGKNPSQQLTTNDNGLTKTQEILYRKEFKEFEQGQPMSKAQDKHKKYT